MKIKSLWVTALLLAGCGSNYYLNGKSEAQFANDKLECQAISQRLTGVSAMWTVEAQTCMQGKGYTIAR